MRAKVNAQPTVNTEDEGVVYTLPAGYVDENGVEQTEFTLREIIGKDEEAMKKSDVRSNASKVINLLLSRCCTRIGSLTRQSVGGDKWNKIIQSLLIGDQDYMLIKLREISKGDEINVVHTCPNCRTKLNTSLTTDELNFEPFKGNRNIDFELPKGYTDRKGVVHKKGIMRLANGLDREILTPLAKTNIAKAETLLLTRLCAFEDYPVDENVMSSLTLRDREYLQKLLEENFFGYKLDVEVTCDQCGEVFSGSMNVVNFI